MFALMNEDGTLNRITNDTAFEWGGGYHSNVRAMTRENRAKFRILDAEDRAGSFTVGSIPNGENIEIKDGVVTRTQLWRQPTAAESAESEKVQAANDLSASDLQMGRVCEDLIDTLISKGVISLSELPAKAQEKLSSRRALRAKVAANG